MDDRRQYACFTVYLQQQNVFNIKKFPNKIRIIISIQLGNVQKRKDAPSLIIFDIQNKLNNLNSC